MKLKILFSGDQQTSPTFVVGRCDRAPGARLRGGRAGRGAGQPAGPAPALQRRPFGLLLGRRLRAQLLLGLLGGRGLQAVLFLFFGRRVQGQTAVGGKCGGWGRPFRWGFGRVPIRRCAENSFIS